MALQGGTGTTAPRFNAHLQQLLVLSRLKLGQGKRLAAQPIPSCTDIITQTDSVSAEALTNTRTLVAELSSPVLCEHGLAAALKWFAQYTARYEIDVTVHAVRQGLRSILDGYPGIDVVGEA